jgi:CRP-like cAMP-binding protein
MPHANDLKRKLDTIRSHPSFERNSTQELVPLAGPAEWVSFKRGDMIFHQGDIPKHAHIVHTGRVKVFKTSAAGQSFTAMLAGPANTLNAVACFGPKPRFFSAEALGDVCLLAIPAKAFVDFVISHAVTARLVISIMGTHLLSAYNRIMDLIEEGVEQRILNVLTLLYKRLGANLPLTNADLAELAGTTRETTARVVSRLDESGLLAKNRGRIEILNPVLLKEMAGDRYFFI